MAFDVTDKNYLKQLLRDNCFDFAMGVANWTQDAIKSEIQKQVYDSYTPVVYKRTGDFLRSVDIESEYADYDISSKIGINPALMSVGSGEFLVHKTRIRKGRARSKGNQRVVYGVHANNKLQDERADIATYVLGELGPSRPWGYNKNKKKVALHNYPGHGERDIITPVMDQLDDIADTVAGRLWGSSIDLKSVDVRVGQ